MMNFVSKKQTSKRRGAVAPMSAVLMVFLVAMVAFAVDMNWLVMTRSELQNAADAAALAGANRMGDNYVNYSLPGQSAANKTTLISTAISTAKSTAITYASYNSAGGVNALNLLSSDIEVGFTSSTGTYTSNTSNPNLYPNTIKITMRRDSTANGSLSMYFANVLGISSIDVQATATAMSYGGTINSLKTGQSSYSMLPITYDVNAWNTFLRTGKDPDGNTSTDSSGNPTLQIFPSTKDTGNFGWISLSDAHVGASTLSGWITSGPSSTDIQTLLNNGLIPLSSHNSNLWDWQGDTGFKASDVSTVNANIGKTYVIPLFKPYNASDTDYSAGSGNGSNYFYDVTQFATITIVQPSDSNRQVMVKPGLLSDPAMVVLDGASIAPIGTSSTFVTALAPPKLTN